MGTVKAGPNAKFLRSGEVKDIYELERLPEDDHVGVVLDVHRRGAQVPLPPPSFAWSAKTRSSAIKSCLILFSISCAFDMSTFSDPELLRIPASSVPEIKPSPASASARLSQTFLHVALLCVSEKSFLISSLP